MAARCARGGGAPSWGALGTLPRTVHASLACRHAYAANTAAKPCAAHASTCPFFVRVCSRARVCARAAEEEARRLKAEHETARRVLLAAQAEEEAARHAAAREVLALTLQAEDELIKVGRRRGGRGAGGGGGAAACTSVVCVCVRLGGGYSRQWDGPVPGGACNMRVGLQRAVDTSVALPLHTCMPHAWRRWTASGGCGTWPRTSRS